LQADHGRDKRVGQFCRRTKAAPKMIDSGEMIFVLVIALSVARSTGVRGGGAVQKNPIDF